MKVVFVYPDVLVHRYDWTGYFYSGIGLLSALLKQDGHETALIHIAKPIDKQELLRQVEAMSPDLIAFSATSPMFQFVRQYAAWFREAGWNVPTICGGIHPTVMPEETIQTEGIDMICHGEGEGALVELCRKMAHREDITQIQNIWVRQNGSVYRNPLRPVVKDLDSLPLADREIFDMENLYNERHGLYSFLVSRGCPYSCTYCCNHLLRRIYGDPKGTVRFRSVDNIIAEIKACLERYPAMEALNFDDDILFFRKDWSEEFADKYSQEIGLPFICNTRANLMDQQRIDLLKKAGCRCVKFGLESGNETICNEVLGRAMSLDHVRKAFRLCHEVKLETVSFNMVGVPHDTPRTILDTIKLNAEIHVDKMQVSIFQPFPGTDLAVLCEKEGLTLPRDLQSDWYVPSMRLKDISRSHVCMFRNYFKAFVRYYQMLNALPRPLSRLMINVSDRMLCGRVIPRVMNGLYLLLNGVFRQLQSLKWRLRASRYRRRQRPNREATQAPRPAPGGKS